MRRRLIGIGVLLLLAWGCSDTSSFWVTIRFPDPQSKDEAQDLSVYAIEPAEGSGCPALMDGTAVPNDSGYAVEDRVDITMPATEGSRPLEGIGPGQRLFFVEATDQQDQVFLRGCTSAKAGGRGVQTVIVTLEKLPGCNITRQGQEWCDNLDNDCDGETDEDCIACQTDADCVDADSCLEGACTDGTCSTDPSADGTACDDGLYCTDNDQCTTGTCAGTARDCSSESDDCNEGVCDEGAGACVKQALTDGAGCEDGLYCTTGETCLSGVPGSPSTCQGGQPRDCSASAGECVEGSCNEADDLCEGRPMQDGEDCDDGQYCNMGETCLSGACQGGQPRDCSASGGSCVDGNCNENQGRCVGTNVDAGTACIDDLFCTENDACDGQGNCLGDPVDCSNLDDDCNQGVCDDQADACIAVPANEGGSCADGLYCTVSDTCQSGTCTAGQPRDCSAMADECHDGDCQEFLNRCRAVDKPAGESCDDGIDCTSPDECDGDGTCVGVPDDTRCLPGEYCRPTCASSPTGCMQPPILQVDCPDTPVPVGQTAACTVTAEGPSQADCITCTPHLLHLNMPLVEFSLDGQPTCGLQGWQLESGDLCQDPGALPVCPLDSTKGVGPSPCCTNLVCPTETWSAPVQEAVEADRASCNDKEWRLYKIFDFRGFDQGRVCHDFGGVDLGALDHYQFQVDPLDESQRDVVRCRNCANFPTEVMMLDCHDLPAAVFGWAQTRLTIWMRSDIAGHALSLDNLWVTAQYSPCQPTTVVAFEEDFEGCPATITDGWNGWNVVQGTPRCLNTSCASDGLEADTPESWIIEHDVDTSALTEAVHLCWTLGDETNSIAQFLVEFDTGTGRQPAYLNDDNLIYGSPCEKICRELTAIDPAAAANPSLRIRFDATTTNNAMILDDIVVSGPERCDATGELQAGAVTSSGTDYTVDVSNPGDVPYLVHLECEWGGLSPPVTASDSFRFLLP